MTTTKIIYLLGLICLLASCTPNTVSIHLTNNLNAERPNETIEILIADLPDHWSSKIDKIGIYDPAENAFLISQLIDVNQDGKMDQLIFQPTMAPFRKDLSTQSTNGQTGSCGLLLFQNRTHQN